MRFFFSFLFFFSFSQIDGQIIAGFVMTKPGGQPLPASAKDHLDDVSMVLTKASRTRSNVHTDYNALSIPIGPVLGTCPD